MKSAEIKFVGELRRLDVQPGDRFVLQYDGYLSREGYERIMDAWKQFMGDDADKHKVLILDKGWKAGALRVIGETSVNGLPKDEDSCYCGGGDASGHAAGCPEREK